MYKAKNLKRIHEQQFNKNKQLLVSEGINPNNPPNPYDIIKQQQAKMRLQKQLNKNLPYKWAREQTVSNNQICPQEDPNASITISRAEMSRQGFQREMNQSLSSHNLNNRQNTNTNNNFDRNDESLRWNRNNPFQISGNNNNQTTSVQQLNTISNKNNWFDQLFDEDSDKVRDQPSIQPKNNFQPNNTFKPNNSYQPNSSYQRNQYESANLNQYVFRAQANNNQPQNNQHYKNYQQSNFNPQQQNSYNQYNNNKYEQKPVSQKPFKAKELFNKFNNNTVEQKPGSQKPFKAKDLFRKQQPSQNETQQRERPSQRIYKNYQKLQGIVECDKTKNLTTVKILSSVETISAKNYIVGDAKMWQVHNQYPDHVLKQALRHFPHVEEFKNNQKAIIKCALNGNDVFICIPTGGGKSLIFQLMTFIKKGIYLCVLPLVSLIYDQQLQAQKYSIEAYSFTGATEASKARTIISKIQNYKAGQESILIFCTPQKIAASQNFVELLTGIYLKGYLQHVIIDQVHCVSTWGKEFRKQYENLSTLKEFFPKIPILGLTATVTQTVKQEIIQKLRLRNCYFFQSSFNRPNLLYQVRLKSKRSAMEQICRILEGQRGNSGIIYCLSKKECEQMCKSLNTRGYRTAYYHADLHDKEKREVQLMWMEDKINVIIATIAFGMGINKPDVRFVIHNSLSKSLEGYYQESGRAGRDGLPARCILFYNRSDRTALQSMILKNDYSSAAQKHFGMQQLSQMVNYCEEKYICRRQFQLNYLGEKDFDPVACNKTCDNCKKGLFSKDFQCVVQAKQIVRVVQFVVESKDRITKSQLINTLKGKDPNNYHKVLRYPKLNQVRTIFKFWTNDHLEELLLELLTHQILKEHAVTAKLKFGMATNLYIEYNSIKSKKFLDQVQTFPMRRVVKPEMPNRGPSFMQHKPQFNIEDFFSDSDEQKDLFGQKQTKSDYDEMNIINEPHGQVDFSSADEMGIDLGHYQYQEGLSSEFFDVQAKVENHDWRNNKIKLQLNKGSNKQQQKVQTQNQNESYQQKKKTKSSIDYIMQLFQNDDDDVLI